MKGRQVAMQMGIRIMGTIGVLLVANKEKLLSREEVMNCIRILKITGRHISDKLYEQLIKKLSDREAKNSF
jgi:Predicted nucleic acid-binding protein, contains PIN domain